MRHAGATLTLSIVLLATAMIHPAYVRGLVSAARRQELLLPHSLPTGRAAITLARSQLRQRVNTALQLGSPHLRGRRPSIEQSVVMTPGQLSPRYSTDDRTDDCAFGADDVAGPPYDRPKLRKLRCLMIDNSGDPPRRKGGWYRAVKACYRNAYLMSLETRLGMFVSRVTAGVISRRFRTRGSRTAGTPTPRSTRRSIGTSQHIGIAEFPCGGATLRRVAADGAMVSVLEGDVWPPGGPPICAGVDLSESSLEPL